MSTISDANKIDVKNLALVGQRVIKVQVGDSVEYHPIGLSSLEPNGGGAGGSSMSFYECASYTPDAGWSGYEIVWQEATTVESPPSIRLEGTGISGVDGEYTIVDPTAVDGDREWERKLQDAEGVWLYNKKIYWHGTQWLLDDGVNAVSHYAIEDVTETATIEEIVAANWFDLMVEGNETFTKEVVINSTSTPAGYVKSETLTEGLEVKGYAPRVGNIYNFDTTIEVKRAFDGSAFPITEDGLVFYAPVQEDYVDVISKSSGTVENCSISVYNGIPCTYITAGSAYWSAADSGLTGSQTFSIVIMFAQPEAAEWQCLIGVSPEGNRDSGVSIFTRNSYVYVFLNGSDNSTTGAITEGKWHTAVMVVNNGTVQVFCDGNSVATINDTVSLTADMIYLGADLGQSSHHNFSGYLAHAAAYNRALSAAEVLDTHNSLIAGATQ